MTYRPEAIVITPEQIIAAAQKIVDSHDHAWEHTPKQYMAATEHWLRIKVNELLHEAAHYANQSHISGNFDLELNCERRSRNKYRDGLWHRCENPALPHSPFCETHDFYGGEVETATELVMPQPPEWAKERNVEVEIPGMEAETRDLRNF